MSGAGIQVVKIVGKKLQLAVGPMALSANMDEVRRPP